MLFIFCNSESCICICIWLCWNICNCIAWNSLPPPPPDSRSEIVVVNVAIDFATDVRSRLFEFLDLFPPLLLFTTGVVDRDPDPPIPLLEGRRTWIGAVSGVGATMELACSLLLLISMSSSTSTASSNSSPPSQESCTSTFIVEFVAIDRIRLRSSRIDSTPLLSSSSS